jgi:hypothetical protein
MFPKLFLRPKSRYLILAAISLMVVFAGVLMLQPDERVDYGNVFIGERALVDAAYQMELGPRTPGSEAHEGVRDYIAGILSETGWQVETPAAEMLGHPIHNIIAKRDGAEGGPWIIVGAHYDSRFFADQDADLANRLLPVPGANDGASGVAVLLELARVLPEQTNATIWLAFFDAEDNGGIEGWDWILGSRALADSLEGQPDAVVIVDMIGDADLQIYLERNSTPELAAEIWAQAAALGHDDVFINSVKFSMLDDHTPFLAAGIPAVDLIDFDYPYWHTRQDTLDKLSAQSLQVVGETVLAWLLTQ